MLKIAEQSDGGKYGRIYVEQQAKIFENKFAIEAIVRYRSLRPTAKKPNIDFLIK